MINEARINESRLISKNAMEIVKYYDNQLAEITNRILENKEIMLKDSLRMKYLIETFNKL